MTFFKFVFLFLFTTIIYAKPLIIDDKTSSYDLLPHSQIYIDNTKSLTLQDIQKKDITFEDNTKSLLGYGYSPDFNVWVKFTIQNNTNKSIEKIIEYDNSLTTEVTFFNFDNSYFKVVDGLFNINKRKTINPVFRITIEPNKSKTYYLKAGSYITPLILKLNILDKDEFYIKEMEHQIILAVFFGAMLILALYNLFIFFFTRDISYLFYVLYIIGIITHQLVYVGIGSVYLFSQDWVINIVNNASILVSFPIFALALFTRTFLQTSQYPIFNKILITYLIAIPLSIVFFNLTGLFLGFRNTFFISLMLFLFILTIYAAFKKNRQAYFIVFGWLILFIAWFMMHLSSSGLFNIYTHFPYIIEIALLSEATIFSIALADSINYLQKDKDEANQRLLTQQQNETQRLEIQVEEKTSDLKTALDEKGLLLKELNHRVKNNMQMIVSLIRLQSDEIEDERIKTIFQTAQNRINAMSHLHELLYKQDNISHINAYEYFTLLIEELKDSYDNDIEISFDIKAQLKMEQAIYCGIILNELITNSFKYAFKNGVGKINISLTQIENIFNLCVCDDGIGYNKDVPSNSLGLVLVKTLSQQQLRGKINIDSSNGVKVNINWSAYG